ncbi:MAG: tRNA (adenosine(37)-N6)-threonylcarbamoyltransferase complex dimerization subunit type 1 TsaB [Candidatus Tokpelaia sp.]|nr:MAG: tRNA (adenosine(37)-N6)-threonylcarbamoyltransferase complex dimerization subunit type 1 TsaB [Candidatus Tokpelaia sp.]KAA6207343.1 MAG: tRNA (adenosine(37)-N6)-threonylcarbamoyltransferase complex dimerization subunit type 1 TsaB [Candidatus Tokpelaia sp.]
MLVLALDTASVFCSAALAENGHIIAARQDNIGTGHAEHLLQQIAALMRKAEKNFTQIDRIGVNIGPGSFTGIRIGVAAARALALALAKPAIGVSAFAALRAQAVAESGHKTVPAVYVVLQALQNGLYWQYFAANGDSSAPQSGTAEDIAAFMRHQPANEAQQTGRAQASLLIGSGAAGLAALLPPQQAACLRIAGSAPTADIAFFAAAAAELPAKAAAPVPLYMRAPAAQPRKAELPAAEKSRAQAQYQNKKGGPV